jgi:hypothetical protein
MSTEPPTRGRSARDFSWRSPAAQAVRGRSLAGARSLAPGPGVPVTYRHLGRRFVTSMSPRPPSKSDDAWAQDWLLATEVELWRRMSNPDRRHAVEVARRFAARRADATRAEMAGALLHDVGKIESGLGTLSRVAATVVGPRTERFRAYHDHEAIGARLAEAAGSDPVTVELIEGRGASAPDLRAADDV